MPLSGVKGVSEMDITYVIIPTPSHDLCKDPRDNDIIEDMFSAGQYLNVTFSGFSNQPKMSSMGMGN
jgi:hypothetical protein